jgi:hypothetical protein
MQVGRETDGDHALIVLTVDQSIPPQATEKIAHEIGAHIGRKIDLVD